MTVRRIGAGIEGIVGGAAIVPFPVVKLVADQHAPETAEITAASLAADRSHPHVDKARDKDRRKGPRRARPRQAVLSAGALHADRS